MTTLYWVWHDPTRLCCCTYTLQSLLLPTISYERPKLGHLDKHSAELFVPGEELVDGSDNGLNSWETNGTDCDARSCWSCHAVSSLARVSVIHDGRTLESASWPVELDAGWCSSSYRHLAITGLVPVVTRVQADRCRWSTLAEWATNCSTVAAVIFNAPSTFHFFVFFWHLLSWFAFCFQICHQFL